jgi:hypothetical protein
MTTEVIISCPHCRRQYPIKVDPERLQRLKTRATCGRCGNAFDVAARVAAAAAAAQAAPRDPRAEPQAAAPSPLLSALMNVAGPSSTPAAETSATPAAASEAAADAADSNVPKPVAEEKTPTREVPQLSRMERIKPPAPPRNLEGDDMAELAREFADAAARFTPVGKPPLLRDEASAATTRNPPVTPPRAAEGDSVAAPPSAAESAPTAAVPPVTRPASSPSVPLVSPSSSSSSSLRAMQPSSSSSSSSSSSLRAVQPSSSSSSSSLLTPPPGKNESLLFDDLGDRDFDAAEGTLKRQKPAAPQPPSWMELADPGLDALHSPPSAVAALLDGILLPSQTPPVSSS